MAAGGDLERMGAGSDNRHSALQHVEELRQLIKARFPKETANAGDATIPLARLASGICVGCLDIHGAEFPDLDVAPIEANPHLPKDYGAAAFKTNCGGDQDHQGE